MESSPFSAVRFIGGFALVFSVIYAFSMEKESPITLIIFAVILIAAGIPSTYYGFKSIKPYMGLMDYEPTTLTGKSTTGKNAREILWTFSTLGSWAVLAGIALLIIAFLNL